ncbi:hypothetical protein EII12_08550 [Buchananella hordeovulneris]|uniref:hypothetical protein n=1 Tax=Buchananella hordeovulneris TaxID=52770 RepID=UPI000F5DA076|nr:hypothetical protein [Buchananella hordeovulneris]RRD51276.1 hypothetical protein EII12_08550 [Buchananella hordeovulneris]
MTRTATSDSHFPAFGAPPLPQVAPATGGKLLTAHLLDVACLAGLGAVAWLVRPSPGFVGMIVGEGLVVLALTRAILGRSPGAYVTGTAWVRVGTNQAPGLGRAFARVGLLTLLLLTVVGPAVSVALSRNGQDWVDRLLGISGVDVRQPVPASAGYARRPANVGASRAGAGRSAPLPPPPPQHAAPAGGRRADRGGSRPDSLGEAHSQRARSRVAVPAGAGLPSAAVGQGASGGKNRAGTSTGQHPSGPGASIPMPRPVTPPAPLGAARPTTPTGTGARNPAVPHPAPPAAGPRAVPTRPPSSRTAQPSTAGGEHQAGPRVSPVPPPHSAATTGRANGVNPAPAAALPPNITPRRSAEGTGEPSGRHRADGPGPATPRLHTVASSVPTHRAPSPSAVTPSGSTSRVPGGFLPGATPSTTPPSEGLTGPIPKVESRPVPTTAQLSRSVLLRPGPAPTEDGRPKPAPTGGGKSTPPAGASPAQPQVHVIEPRSGKASQSPESAGPQVHVVGPPRTRRAARRAEPPR